MNPNIELLTHSSIIIIDNKQRVFYFDPFNIRNESHDADVIFITHDHFDHFSIKDINKIAKENTLFVIPYSLRNQMQHSFKCLKPFEKCLLDDIEVEARPAYNINKHYHPKDNEWLGYIVKIDNQTIYVVGDSDNLPENENVNVDILMVPIGGQFTMNLNDAAHLTNSIKPKIVIPTHYGSVVGSDDLAEQFKKLIDESIEVRIIKQY